MARDRRNNRNDLDDDALSGDEDRGWMSRVIAEEDTLDRRTMWRLASWGAGTVGIIVASLMILKSPMVQRRDQLAAMETQAQQVQWIARESQNSARQLSAAVETLNGDRDRLYARVTVLEQGLDSVTGSIAKQIAAATLPQIPAATPPAAQAATPAETAAARPDAQAKPDAKAEAIKSDAVKIESAKAEIKDAPPAPRIGPVASVPAAPSGEKKLASDTERKEMAKETVKESIKKTAVTGAIAPNAGAADASASDAVPEKPVQRTAFGVDLGGANSIEGLRGLWRSMQRANSVPLQSLQPIVVIKEGNDGLGMRLHLIAGPLNDAAAAAKICAAIIENKRSCETSVYDGQRLSMHSAPSQPDAKPQPRKRRSQAQPPEPPAPARSTFSSIFGIR